MASAGDDTDDLDGRRCRVRHAAREFHEAAERLAGAAEEPVGERLVDDRDQAAARGGCFRGRKRAARQDRQAERREVVIGPGHERVRLLARAGIVQMAVVDPPHGVSRAQVEGVRTAVARMTDREEVSWPGLDPAWRSPPQLEVELDQAKGVVPDSEITIPGGGGDRKARHARPVALRQLDAEGGLDPLDVLVCHADRTSFPGSPASPDVRQHV